MPVVRLAGGLYGYEAIRDRNRRRRQQVLAIGYSLFALLPLRDFYQYAMNVGPGTSVARDPPSVAAFTAGKIRHPTGIFPTDTGANSAQQPDTARV